MPGFFSAGLLLLLPFLQLRLASFTYIGILYLPIDYWVKGFVGMGLTFSVSSSFTLAKTIRDNHESTTLTARIDEARVEKILAEHHPLK